MINARNIVASCISADRFGSYLAHRNGDVSRAFALYEWNARMCASFYVPLQIVEVAFRNARHRELLLTFGQTWTTNPAFLGIDRVLHNKVDGAENEVRRAKHLVDTPHTVAALSFGFWTTLLSNHLEHPIWIPALHRAFPEYQAIVGMPITRAVAAQRFNDIRNFRNRVAHHEPIYYRKLADELRRLEETASWLSSDLVTWFATESANCLAFIAGGPPP